VNVVDYGQGFIISSARRPLLFSQQKDGVVNVTQRAADALDKMWKLCKRGFTY
jgi:hypothetical protein